MRRLDDGARCGPAGRLVTCTRAAPGLRSGANTGALRGARCIGRRKCRFKKRGPGLMVASQRKGTTCKCRRWSAGRRTHRKMRARLPAVGRASLPQGVRPVTAPSGAPLPHVGEGRNEGPPRALQRTGAAERWLNRLQETRLPRRGKRPGCPQREPAKRPRSQEKCGFAATLDDSSVNPA